jgi:hypothetical protein
MTKVKDFGNTKIVTSSNGNTIHLSESAHDTSLNRLFKSKRFNRLPKGREVLKEGEVKMLAPKKLQYVDKYEVFLFPIMQDGKLCYFWCKKVSNRQVRVRDMERVYECVPTVEVLVSKVFSYSFTIKTSNMTTKVAPKKVSKATKQQATGKAKAKAPKADADKGPGKIEQIIALHKQGLSNKEIVEKGFNKTTVSIQVSKFKRAKEAAKADKKSKKA